MPFSVAAQEDIDQTGAFVSKGGEVGNIEGHRDREPVPRALRRRHRTEGQGQAT